MRINKVVVPVAGLGTRMLPSTKTIPKEMLPISGKPIIQYIVEEASNCGFKEIIFVTQPDKYLVADYFDRNLKLETHLEKKMKKSNLKEIKNITKLGSKILLVDQEKPKGLGHAILCAKSFISNEPFAVMLPDMILDSKNKQSNLLLMKKNFEKSGLSSILLGKVNKSDIESYGIVKFKKGNRKEIFFPLDDIIEKPSPKKAPSNLFVAGRYIFNNEIIKFLDKEKPDSNGEIQLTGAISKFLKASNPINGLLLDGAVYDCGNKLGYLIANLAYSFKDRKIKNEVLKFTKK